MMNIKISKYAINMADNCRIIKVRYGQPVNGKFHPFDTRAEESHYISEAGYSFLSDIDSITQKECIDSIEEQLSSNKHIRFIYQRLLIVHNGVIIWDSTKNSSYSKEYFKGFVVHALYGEFIAGEHKYGYNITATGMCADEEYVWESCDYALGRALNFSRKNPDNYCLLSGINFDYNEVIKGSPAPPWAISELTSEIMQNMIIHKGTNVIYNTDVFFKFFNTLTKAEKKSFIKKYPEPPVWKNWYTAEGAHQNTDVTEQYNLYIKKMNERKQMLKSVSSSVNQEEKKDDIKIIDEAQYLMAKDMFFQYNGSLADMCADDSISKYMQYCVPKALEKKWTDELIEIWLENIINISDITVSVSEIVNIIHKDNNIKLIVRLTDAVAKSYFLMDSYTLLTIFEMIFDKVSNNSFGENDEFIYMLDKFEVFIVETIERKIIKCDCDISEMEIRERFALILKKIITWQTEKIKLI